MNEGGSVVELMNLHMYQYHVRRKKFLWNSTRELVFVEMAEKTLVQDYDLVKKNKKETVVGTIILTSV